MALGSDGDSTHPDVPQDFLNSNERSRIIKIDQFVLLIDLRETRSLASVVTAFMAKKSSNSAKHLLKSLSRQAYITRLAPQWWSGRWTTPHDMLNMWSPICDRSVWGTQGRGWAHSVTHPSIPISSILTHKVISNRLVAISKVAGSQNTTSRCCVEKCLWYGQLKFCDFLGQGHRQYYAIFKVPPPTTTPNTKTAVWADFVTHIYTLAPASKKLI